MTVLLAHGSAHWLESVIMLLPIPIVLGFIGVSVLRERRRDRGAQPPGASDSTNST